MDRSRILTVGQVTKTFLTLAVIVTIFAESGCGGGTMPNSQPPSVAAKVLVSPASATIQEFTTQQFYAKVYDQSGNLLSGATVGWTVTGQLNPLGFPTLTLTPAGNLSTIAQANGTGVVTITAQIANDSGGTVSGSAQLTVLAEGIKSITLSQALPFGPGVSQITVKVIDDAGNDVTNDVPVEWFCSYVQNGVVLANQDCMLAIPTSVSTMPSNPATWNLGPNAEFEFSLTGNTLTINGNLPNSSNPSPGILSVVAALTAQGSSQPIVVQ